MLLEQAFCNGVSEDLQNFVFNRRVVDPERHLICSEKNARGVSGETPQARVRGM